MSWINDIQKAIKYIENNLLEPVSADEIATKIGYTCDYFQKTFSIITGLTLSEYIRNRRLTLAGQDLTIPRTKVIDVALKYGYETHESFTKAFTRFHGFAPSKTRSLKKQLKRFKPLSLDITINGGFDMTKSVTWWDENNAESRMHNNGLTDFMIINPSLDEIESAIENLGKSEEINNKHDYDFLIFDMKESPRGDDMYMQTAIEKGSGTYEVHATYFRVVGIDKGERVTYKTYLTDVNELKKLFTAFALGIAPDTTNWDNETEQFPLVGKEPEEYKSLTNLYKAGILSQDEYLDKLKIVKALWDKNNITE